MTVLAIAFWISVGLLLYTHLGYPALLWLLGAGSRRPRSPRARRPSRPASR